ncbi:hypothetical protein P3T76_013672 [Phytophthora citrophthora]|uniref:Uncharacterized protein n=1 Tax=Phytophthora citrophthora TaxID=4793 RepID=A0AAD9G310_9STRA|nr:hypothetical protein P3T76_013672 [Phytophthora citrophthora]
MNQVPVETSQELLNDVASPAAPVKAEKLHDSPEVDRDEDSERTGKEGGCGGNQLGFDSISDEPMAKYDGFQSVGKPFLRHLGGEDKDVVNVRSPIICNLSGSRSTTSSPTCVSTLKDDEPSWTIQEFQEYLGMMELLQDVCSNSDGEEMRLSAASLGKMERLLTSLLPQGV